ncbi:MAG: hypothetical protein H6741_00660 [Alphaproteobacteria bacterium]|nr:hypothetical protein [Alphaproteobacteria bacterium]
MNRGWLCDVDRRTIWSEEEIRTRISNTDLLILDWHLDVSDLDSSASLKILQTLADSPNQNLVVLYTKAPELDRILLQIGIALGGILPPEDLLEKEANSQETKDAWDLLEGPFPVLDEHAGRLWLSGKDGERNALRRVQERWGRYLSDQEVDRRLHAPLTKAGIVSSLRQLVENSSGFKDLTLPTPPRPIGICAPESIQRWVHCGNVFVLVLHKEDIEREGLIEAQRVLEELVQALVDWDPSPLRLALTFGLGQVQTGAERRLQDVLPDQMLRVALWYQYLVAKTPESRRDSLVQIWQVLLERLGESVSADILDFLEGLSPDPDAPIEHGDALKMAKKRAGMGVAEPKDVLHRLNAFLCSMPPNRRHVTTGSVVRLESGGQHDYWVCVSPACDMVPREQSLAQATVAAVESDIPPMWRDSLGSCRPTMMVRLQVLDGASTSQLKKATEGRVIFLFDSALGATYTCQVFPRPTLNTEMFFLDCHGKTDANHAFHAWRIQVGCEGPPTMVRAKYTVIAQLRKPYAEAVLHKAGYQLSRVGVDFVNLG